MAKCGNCMIDFQGKRQLVRHMLDVHETVFLDGSEDLQQIQDELIAEATPDGARRKALVEKKKAEVK